MFNVEFEEVTNQFCAEFDTVAHTGEATLGEKTITANGVYNASSDDLDGYSKVTANVPNTYTASDEGKVVDNGALVSQTSATYTSNDTYDTTKINSITVNVSGGGGTMQSKSVSYTPTTSAQTDTVTPDSGYDGLSSVAVSIAAMPTGTEGTPTATKGTVSNHAVAVTPSVTNQAGYIEGGTKTGTAVTVSASELDSGTKSITANGSNQDVVGYAAVDVAVPNSYSAADEGKVVSSGALVAQTSDTVTANDTYDTTLINSLTVNVSGGATDTDLVSFLANEMAYIKIPSATKIMKAYSFRSTPAQKIYLPEVTIWGDATNSVSNSSSIVAFSAPSVTSQSSNTSSTFASDSNIETIDIGSWPRIGGNEFQNCSKLKVLILRRSSVAALASTNAFTGTPFASGGTGGTLYVPNALISSYQGASNWSTILGYANNSIVKIEGSAYEDTDWIDS